MQNQTEIQTQTPETEKKIQMQENLYSIYTKARQDFIKKSFGEKFYNLYLFSYSFTYLLAFISIANAVGFFVGKFESAGIIIAVIIGLFITVLLEYLKTMFFNFSMRGFYAEGKTKTNFVLFLLFAVCLGASVLTSVLGAGELVKFFDKRQESTEQETESLQKQNQRAYKRETQEAEKEHQAHIASLKADYSKRIASEQQGLQEYKNSVTWEGKINIHNPTNAYNIASYQTRITELQKSLQKEIDQANNAHKEKTVQGSKQAEREEAIIKKKYEKTTAKNTESFWNWFAIALVVAGITEALIIVTNWFYTHYRYTIAKREPAKVNAQSPIQEMADSFQSFLYALVRPNQVLPTNFQQSQQVLHQDLPKHLPKNKIGFNRDEQDLPKSYNKSYAKSYQDLPPTLEEALRQGFTHTPSLTAYYGVSINQVHEARKALEKPKPKESLIITDLFASEKGGAV